MKSGNKPGFKSMGSSPAKIPLAVAAQLAPMAMDMMKKNKEEDESPGKMYDSPAKQKKSGGKKIPPKLSELELDEIKAMKLDPKYLGQASWPPTKGKSPAKQKSTKGGEGQDQNKIFDKKGNHIGTYVNGKKVMKSTTSAHGQLSDAQYEFEQDLKAAKNSSKAKGTTKKSNKPMIKKSPTKQVDINDFDDRALDRKEDAEGKGKGNNRKVMNDGAVNKTQAAKIAKRKADFAKKTAAEKKALQDKANAKRKAFEATPEYKARKLAADKKARKVNQANFEPAYEGADYSKEQIKKMSNKQKKDIE